MRTKYFLVALTLLALLAMAGSVSAAADRSFTPEATTTCFQDGVAPTAAYAGTRDSYIRESQPGTNYGGATALTVDGGEGANNTDRWALLKWDVSAIPPGSEVTSASVTFNVADDGTSQTYQQYQVTSAWDEMAVKWNTKPTWASSSLGAVGPFGAGARTVSLATWVVEDWVDYAGANYGLIMADSMNTSGFDLYASEYGTAAQRPKLCVTYNTPAATYTVSKTADTNDGVCNADCSLREAVRAANAHAGRDAIIVPAGTYNLTRAGTGEDAGATGDLDITEAASILGNGYSGAGATIVDARGLDQVFEVHGDQAVSLKGMKIQGGNGPGVKAAYTGGAGSRLSIAYCHLYNNGDGVHLHGPYITGFHRLQLRNSIVSNNVGNGISSSNCTHVEIVGSTIRNNGLGGAFLNSDVLGLTTVDSTFANNNGPGLSLMDLPGCGGNATVINSTFSGNIDTVMGSGGGIFASGTLSLLNSTITGNRSDYGGGFWAANAILQNSIVANNTITPGGGGPDCDGGGTSLGNNIIGNTANCPITWHASDKLNVDPKLAAYTDNGQPGKGHHPLLSNSPAIDAANPSACPSTDQLGNARKDGDGNGTVVCDIGAIEYDPAANSGLIFADSFESGNFSAWSGAVTGGGDLSVTAAAAMKGSSKGMQANIDDNTSLYVKDTRPASETRYNARFYFDPNSIGMTSGDMHYLLTGRVGTVGVLRVAFRRYTTSYQVRAQIRTDAATYTSGSWYTISDGPHAIEIEWKAATAAGANNGSISLWLDGVAKQTKGSIDNDTLRVDEARLGPLAGIDTGTRGVMYFDAFESRRTGYIGLASAAGVWPDESIEAWMGAEGEGSSQRVEELPDAEEATDESEAYSDESEEIGDSDVQIYLPLMQQ